jgi:hypothetical protein
LRYSERKSASVSALVTCRAISRKARVPAMVGRVRNAKVRASALSAIFGANLERRRPRAMASSASE